MDGQNHHWGDKKGRPKDAHPTGTQKEEERASPSRGRTIKGTIHVVDRLYKKWEISII